MLTAEQLELRTSTLGASEIAAVVGIAPRQTALDVFARKRRGRRLELPPLLSAEEVDNAVADLDEGSATLDPRTVGSVLEDAIAGLYEKRTGAKTVSSPTVIHPEHRWRSATPDRLVSSGSPDERRGLECKLVGRWMEKDWPGDGVPDYVAVQCQWSMDVCAAQSWDVAALLGGTSFRVCRLQRDDELIEDLAKAATVFWEKHVLANSMPRPTSGDDLMRIVTRRWQQDNGEVVEASKSAARLAKRLLLLQERQRKVESSLKVVRAGLAGLCGENAGIKGDWGIFTFRSTRGSAKWKAIAEELAGGLVADEIVDRFPGKVYRKPWFRPSSALKDALPGDGKK